MSGEEQVRPPGKADPFAKSRAFVAACEMPSRVKHRPDRSKPFDLADSKVIIWLILEPEIQQWLFERFKAAGAITYDRITKTWGGNSVGLPLMKERK